MGLGHHHGERAFAAFLRGRRTPYVSVNEARRTLIGCEGAATDLKSFDFVVYGVGEAGANLLVDIKCRRLPAPQLNLVTADGVRRTASTRRTRLESWVTQEDVRSLRAWQVLFGPSFKAAFLFVYWCPAGVDGRAGQPPDGLFDEVYLFERSWYAVRGVLLDDYEPSMQVRSARWQTVDLPPVLFQRLSDGFGRRWLARPAQFPGREPVPSAAAGR